MMRALQRQLPKRQCRWLGREHIGTLLPNQEQAVLASLAVGKCLPVTARKLTNQCILTDLFLHDSTLHPSDDPSACQCDFATEPLAASIDHVNASIA